MNPKSAIEKGKRLENHIVKRIEQEGISYATREKGSGSGLRKGDIFWALPITPEAKNEAVPKWMQNIKQAKRQTMDYQEWILFQRNPQEPEFNEIFAVMDFEFWLKTYKKSQEPKIGNPDRDLKQKLELLQYKGQDIIRELEKLEVQDKSILYRIKNFKTILKEVINRIKI